MNRTTRVLTTLLALVATLLPNLPSAVADIDRASPWFEFAPDFDISPDGDYVVFSGQKTGANRQLYAKPTAGGDRIKLSAASQDAQPYELPAVVFKNGWRVSQDSRHVLYRAVHPNGVVQLYSAAIDGSGRRRVNDLLEPGQTSQAIYNFWVSPNSDYVVWVEQRNGAYSLWAADTDGTDAFRLHGATTEFNAPDPSFGGAFPFDFSADGSKVVMAVTRPATGFSIREVKLDGSGGTTIARNLLDVASRLQYTPGGEAVVYSILRAYYQPMAGGPPTAFTPDGISYFTTTRGGEWAIYREENGNQSRRVAVRLDPSLETLIVTNWLDSGETGRGSGWTDGHYYFNDDGNLYRTPLMTGGIPEVVHLGTTVSTSWLSPDGATFYSVKNGDPFAVSTTPGGPITKLVNLKSGATPVFHGFNPAGDQLLVEVDSIVAAYTITGDRSKLDPRRGNKFIPEARFLSNKTLAYVGWKGGEFGVFVADARFCGGFLATHVGTSGDDTIIGTSERDIIVGKAGSDFIRGKAGADRICGGKGGDIIEGGAGSDRVFGQRGSDSIDGGNGDDYLRGNRGNDTINGGAGTDDCKAESRVECE